MYRCCAKLNAEVDYRTSTGVGHEFIHPISEHYEYLQRRLRPEILVRDKKAHDETYVTTTGKAHDWKIGDKDLAQRAWNNKNMSFMRDYKEKNLMHPPWPVGVGACGISEFKDNFPRQFPKELIGNYRAVEPAYICKVRGLGRDEQSPIEPTDDGVLKHLDPYVSVTQMTHVPFTREQQTGVAKKDIDTFYDIIGLPKCKGFGPKKSNFTGPQLSVRRDPVYDVATFPIPTKNILVPTLVWRVPYVGMESEKQAKYKLPIDELSSKRWESGIEFNQPFPRPSPWENLSAPAMYCTEYCHLGSKNFPVRAVVDPYANTKTVKNVMCCDYHPADCGKQRPTRAAAPRVAESKGADTSPPAEYPQGVASVPSSVPLCACPLILGARQPIPVN